MNYATDTHKQHACNPGVSQISRRSKAPPCLRLVSRVEGTFGEHIVDHGRAYRTKLTTLRSDVTKIDQTSRASDAQRQGGRVSRHHQHESARRKPIVALQSSSARSMPSQRRSMRKSPTLPRSDGLGAFRSMKPTILRASWPKARSASGASITTGQILQPAVMLQQRLLAMQRRNLHRMAREPSAGSSMVTAMPRSQRTWMLSTVISLNTQR